MYKSTTIIWVLCGHPKRKINIIKKALQFIMLPTFLLNRMWREKLEISLMQNYYRKYAKRLGKLENMYIYYCKAVHNLKLGFILFNQYIYIVK